MLLHVTLHELHWERHENGFYTKAQREKQEEERKKVLNACNCNADDFNQADVERGKWILGTELLRCPHSTEIETETVCASAPFVILVIHEALIEC